MNVLLSCLIDCSDVKRTVVPITNKIYFIANSPCFSRDCRNPIPTCIPRNATATEVDFSDFVNKQSLLTVPEDSVLYLKETKHFTNHWNWRFGNDYSEFPISSLFIVLCLCRLSAKASRFGYWSWIKAWVTSEATDIKIDITGVLCFIISIKQIPSFILIYPLALIKPK